MNQGCGAAAVVQPMDLVKNRMQVSGEGGGVRLYNNSIHCAQTIIKNEGFFGLYNGLSGKSEIKFHYSQVSLLGSAKMTIMVVFSRNMACLTEF